MHLRRPACFLLCLFPVLNLLGCGGGGGGGGGSAEPDIEGTISVFSATDSVFEAEPNDTIGQAHFLGAFGDGSGVSVFGSVDLAADTLDAFRIEASERMFFDFTLDFDGQGGTDLDVYVFDTVSNNIVQSFEAVQAPELGSFHAKGSFLVLVNAFAGSSNYELRIDAATPADPIAEVEPNDNNGEAQFLGELGAGDALDLSGSASAGADVFDRLTITCPEAIDLDLSLAHAGAADFDLVVYDATLDPEAPVEIVRFESLSNPELGSVTGIAAGTLIQVEILAASASGTWDLNLTATAAQVLTAGGGQNALSGMSGQAKDIFHARGRMLPLNFAKVELELVLGEAILRPGAGIEIHGQLPSRGARELRRTPNGAVLVELQLPLNLTEDARARATLAWVHSMNSRADFSYCEPNYIYRALGEPTDPFYNLQWHYELIQLPSAWDITQGDSDIIVSVIDTGETQHPDLVDRQIPGYDLISDAGNGDDGDGIDPDPTDEGDGNGTTPSSFHGTHVAGTIGASTNNSLGVAGVNWFGKIMHVRALGKQGGTVFDIANSILFSARLTNSSGDLPAQAAHIINMSLGGPGFSQTMQDAVLDARAEGVVIFAAAGNENSSNPSFPAAYDGVISVAAVDFEGNRAPYSNFHPTVDIAAPGGDVSADLNGDGYPDGVLSTLVDDSGAQDEFVFAFYQGTSMACPHAAGVAALLLAVNPNLSPNQIETILESTAADRGAPGKDNIYGHGLINAAAALNQAGGGGGDPGLSLATQEVTFEIGQDEREVAVFNVGGGVLEVNDPTTSTDSGGDWLFAARVTSGSGTTTDTDAIAITVDRGALTDGLYTGSVSVTSNGGDLDIAVAMLVGDEAPIEDIDIFVLVVNPDTFETAAEAVVNPTDTLEFSFDELEPGDYLIFAGSDDNNDGGICGEGDTYCGAWPTLNQPGLITVEDGTPLSNVDFVVASGFNTQGSGTKRSIKRLNP